MITTESEALIACPPDEVFAFMTEGFVQNYPRWSPEVRTLEPETAGPLRIGWSARQVRFDQGRWSDSRFRVTILDPGRRLTFEGIDDNYRIDYRFAPVTRPAAQTPAGTTAETPTETRVLFVFALELSLALRPFESIAWPTVQNIGDQMMSNLKCLIEEELTLGGTRGQRRLG